MFDWLKFFPFTWSYDNKPEEIRGPYFPALRKNKWLLNDSALHFGAPWANPLLGFAGRSRWVNGFSPGRANILKAEWPSVYFSGGGDASPDEWDCQHFYKNSWIFVGPWFTGYQAVLQSSALLISAKGNSSFADKNLFHPRVFESAIASHLNYAYGYTKVGRGKPYYRGPLNWRVLPVSNSIQAVVCDIHPIGISSKENPTLDRHIFIPVAPHQFIQIRLDFGGTVIYNNEVKAGPLFKLCDSIIDSLRLEVGESTQAEWDKVKASCPDMSLTETFGELPWPLKLEKKSKKPKEVKVSSAPGAIEQRQG